MGVGRQVTDAQVQEMRRNLNRKASLQEAAMKAGMDRKTARKYRDRGKLPSESSVPHTWRTRTDPLIEVWPRLEEMLRREPTLQAKTLVEWLGRECPAQDWQRCRRTVERRVRQWKAEHGTAKEVFFGQIHEAGRLGASDFTHMEKLGVTLQGEPFAHLVYHFVLTYSNWEHVTLCFSENFASLSQGLQAAAWELAGVPERHRTDRMTLAVHQDGNLEVYTSQYQSLMRHYGMTAEATNPARGHENGDCEQSHRRFKEGLDQELLLRGSRDFGSREEYWRFVVSLVSRRNASRSTRFQEEQQGLRHLPERRLETLERQRPQVSRGSTIRVKKNTYSVPSRLIGEQVEARIGAETIAVWYAGSLVQEMERLRGVSKHRIDYRHVIDWLVRKPGAFARYVYREDMYPTVTYRQTYDALLLQQPDHADREYLRLLYLASREGESRVDEALVKLLVGGMPIGERAVRAILGSDTPLSVTAQVSVAAVDLRLYDALLDGGSAVDSDMAMSQVDGSKEASHEQGCADGVGGLLTGVATGGGPEPVRGGVSSGDSRIVGVQGVSAGIAATRVPAAAAQADRPIAEVVSTAVGEELGDAGPQTSPVEGSPAVAGAVERRIFGSTGECVGVRPTRLGKDARNVCGGPGVGAGRTLGAGDEMQSVGAGVIEGEAGSSSEGDAPSIVALGRFADRRSGICAAEPGGNGGAVHAAGRTLRAGECAGDEQSGVLAVGADLQRSHDDCGGDRSARASQCNCGDECIELSSRDGEAKEGRGDCEGRRKTALNGEGRGQASLGNLIVAVRAKEEERQP
jgi:hypothetical protein